MSSCAKTDFAPRLVGFGGRQAFFTSPGAGISPSAQELAEVIQRRLPEVRFQYNPDPIRTAIVESWPEQIDDSDARRDWNWRPTWDLERMTDEIIQTLKGELASQ